MMPNVNDCRAAIGEKKEDGSNKFVIRPYTPTSPKDAKGYFDLVVKVYEQGKMSKHFGELKVPDLTLFADCHVGTCQDLHHVCTGCIKYACCTAVCNVAYASADQCNA